MNLANLLDRMGEFGAAEVLHKESVVGLSAATVDGCSRLMVRIATVGDSTVVDKRSRALVRLGRNDTATYDACCHIQAIANHAQHHIERWGGQTESESAPFAKAADMVQVVKNTQTSICKELGTAHAAYPYCTSMLGESR
jgi:hypothetical protein